MIRSTPTQAARRYANSAKSAPYACIQARILRAYPEHAGDIDVDKLRAALEAISPQADDEAVEKMLAFAVADGNKTVSFADFKQIVQGTRERLHELSGKAEKEKGAVAAWSPLDNSLTELFRSQGLALPASLGGPASQQPGAVELVRASGHASSCDGGGELV